MSGFDDVHIIWSISYGRYKSFRKNQLYRIFKKTPSQFFESVIDPIRHLFTGIECIQNRFEVSFEILPYRLACLLQQENNWNFLLVRCKPFRNILMGSRKISIAYSAL